ncbi:unnamed protein product [Heterotrigona itama]|uniref:Uncharacterized protein n=1 Tax=Heterotrigona itama TaxID=395501 RepID=A0A6V7H8D1_9HYME|nr:unnamed protein product [Heterotrigona itama]
MQHTVLFKTRTLRKNTKKLPLTPTLIPTPPNLNLTNKNPQTTKLPHKFTRKSTMQNYYAFRNKFQNVLQAKLSSDKLNIISKVSDFNELKIICQKENIEYHTYDQFKQQIKERNRYRRNYQRIGNPSTSSTDTCCPITYEKE